MPPSSNQKECETIRERDWPKWAEVALQGVTYWIGHRRAQYPHHPLTEGALVAELCNLIYGKLPDAQLLKCEVMYAELLAEAQPSPNTILSERARADLVIVEATKGAETPRFVIEVKRSSAGDSQINADMRRLAEVRRRLKGVRTYLFVVSEARRPERFVSPGGASLRGINKIPNDKGHYRVRTTLKAAHLFEHRDRAQYCCLIEVFGKPTSRFVKSKR